MHAAHKRVTGLFRRASNDFPTLAEEPKILVPEGIFLPTAVRILADVMFGGDRKNDRAEYKKCVALISDWVLTGQLQAFRIGQLCQQKEQVPEALFRRPAIETIFVDGRTEILKDSLPQGFETYLVYLNKKEFEKLAFGKKGGFEKNWGIPDEAELKKIVEKIVQKARTEKTTISREFLYDEVNRSLKHSKITTDWSRSEHKKLPPDVRAARGKPRKTQTL